MSSFFFYLLCSLDTKGSKRGWKSTQSPCYYCLFWSPKGKKAALYSSVGCPVHTTALRRRFLYLKSNNSKGSRLVSQETKWQAGQQGGCRCSSARRALLPLTHCGQTAKTSTCGTSAYQVKSPHLVFYSQAPNRPHPPIPLRAHCVQALRHGAARRLTGVKSGRD